MTKLNSYLSLIRFYNPIGFWLLLWPGLWGLFLSDNFNIENFTIVVLGSFLTRSLGCAINDFLDRDFDKSVERTIKTDSIYNYYEQQRKKFRNGVEK